MPSGTPFRLGPDTSGVTARSAAVTGAKIGASIGSRAGPVGAGVGSGFGGAVGYLIGSSIDGITPIPDGGRPIEDGGRPIEGGDRPIEDAEAIHRIDATDPLTATTDRPTAVSSETRSRREGTADEEPVVIDVVEE